MGAAHRWDMGIAAVTERLSTALDAPAVLQNYSRLVIDCNRRPDWESRSRQSASTPKSPAFAACRKPNARRGAARFDPYHRRIAELLDRRAVAGRRTVLLAMHSFTPVFKGETRNVEVGVLYNRDVRLASIMLDLLRAEGDLAVGDNAPYAITDTSDYTVPTHGEARGLAHVEIEIRQDLIADAAGQDAWAAASRPPVAAGRRATAGDCRNRSPGH